MHREIFNLVDRDGGGSISKKELKQLMDTLAINASQQEIELMIGEIDKNNDGEIQFEEFVAVMSRKVKATYTAEEVKHAFKVFEGDCSHGHIRVSELERALTIYGSDRLSAPQVTELINQIESDTEGNFNYADYVNMMMAE
jgi:calmodulin